MLYLSPDITDYILDFLHDSPQTLKRCSLAARSSYSNSPFETCQIRAPWTTNRMEGDPPRPRELTCLPYAFCLSLARDGSPTRTLVGTRRSLTLYDWIFGVRPGRVAFLSIPRLLAGSQVSQCDLPLRQVSDLISSFPLFEDQHISGFR